MTKGAAPCAVKVACTVLNGGDEETYRKATRLVPTQRECDHLLTQPPTVAPAAQLPTRRRPASSLPPACRRAGGSPRVRRGAAYRVGGRWCRSGPAGRRAESPGNTA